MKVALLKMEGGEPLLAVPKLALTWDEVTFAVGSETVARGMRQRGYLVPCNSGPLLFDAADVRRAWELWKAAMAEEGEV